MSDRPIANIYKHAEEWYEDTHAMTDLGRLEAIAKAAMRSHVSSFTVVSKDEANAVHIATFSPPVVLALIAVARAAGSITIGAGILSVLEDAGPAFKDDRMGLLTLRSALAALQDAAKPT